MDKFVVTAPTRVDLAGGTLDIWPLHCLLGKTKTINVALDLTTSVEFESQSDCPFSFELVTASGTTHSFSKILSREDCNTLPEEIRFPAFVASTYFSQMADLPATRVRIRWRASAPPRSGLGGSSTLCVALARGLSRIFRDYVQQGWQWTLLGWVKDTEAAFLRVPTGTQDYLAALFGGANCFQFEPGGISQHPYSPSFIGQLQDRMLVLFSGEMHNSGVGNWEIFKRAIEGDKEIWRGLGEIQAIADGLDSELRTPKVNWREVGRALEAEWRVRKQLFGVHTARLDEILEFLTQQKVLGAKVCGAAQGGSLIALVEPGELSAVASACRKAGIEVLRAPPTALGVSVVPEKKVT